jgi:hypothetical protein
VVKVKSTEEFELHVHNCFSKIFELLMKVDGVVKEEAEKEEAAGEYGKMNDLRDWVEDVILHCHLAWQYHRLSLGPLKRDLWDKVNNPGHSEKSNDGQDTDGSTG